jgi:hypothetical protein
MIFIEVAIEQDSVVLSSFTALVTQIQAVNGKTCACVSLYGLVHMVSVLCSEGSLITYISTFPSWQIKALVMSRLVGERGWGSPADQPADSSQGRQFTGTSALLRMDSHAGYIPHANT